MIVGRATTALKRRALCHLQELSARIEHAFENARFEALRDEDIVAMGRHSYGTPRINIWRDGTGRPVGGRVEIGSFCAIGPGVEIFTGGDHRVDWVPTFPLRIEMRVEGAWADGAPSSRGDVIIGHDVWIGKGSTILSGITIGSGAVLAACCVVTRDVRPYSIVAGNPAREVRLRFSPDRIDRLCESEWWNWPDGEIQKFIPLLSSDNVDEFLRRGRGNDRSRPGEGGASVVS